MSDKSKDGLTSFADLGGVDPAIQSLLAQGERRQTESHLSVRERRKKVKERAQIERRRAFRVTYDLPPSIRDRIAKLAEAGRYPASQLAAVLLFEALKRLETGEIDLFSYRVPSDSPRYEWNLDLPDSPRKHPR